MRELLEQHVPSVFRFARRLTGDAHAAEDLTQDTLLRAWRSRDRLAQPEAARVWLFRIAVNLWRDRLRRSQVRTLAAEKQMRVIVESEPPGRRIERREQVDAALAALDTLPDRQRDVLYLNACEGLSIEQISDVLDSTTNAVKANLSLGRKRMRELLAEREAAQGHPR